MFLLSPDIIEAHWMEAPLLNGGTKWWLAWLSPKNLTTMWGENGQLVQSKIIAADDAEVKLEAKLREKHGKGYQLLAEYTFHLWTSYPGVKLPAFPPSAKPDAYSETPDSEIAFGNPNRPEERLILKNVRGSFLSLGNAFRLEHYINKPHLTYMTYPTWQTLFPTRDEAVAVVRDVIEKRKAQGMDARGDMELLNPHVPIDFVLVPGALAWDF